MKSLFTKLLYVSLLVKEWGRCNGDILCSHFLRAAS